MVFVSVKFPNFIHFIHFRWFWHFYAISAGWNGILLFFYVNSIIYHQSYPQWLSGLLDILTGAPSIYSQGRLSVPVVLNLDLA